MSKLTNEWELSLKVQHFIQPSMYLEHMNISDQGIAQKETAQKAKSTVLALFLVPYKQFWNSISLLQYK